MRPIIVKREKTVETTNSTSVEVVTGSTDYDRFRFLKGYNRDVTVSGENKVTKALQKYGFIGVAIILKTKAFGKLEYVVADAQHRITACKKLKIPFNYQIIELDDDTPKGVMQFISSYNSSATTWNPSKFLNAFAEVGIYEYTFLLRKLEETGLTITDLQNIYLGGSGSKEMEMFKSGDMVFPDIASSEKLKKAVLLVKDVLPNKAFTRRSLFKAFKQTSGRFLRFAKAIKSAAKFVASKDMILPENETLFFDWLMNVYDNEFDS